MPKLKPFCTYDAEGDSFTLHFYLGKEVGGSVVPCLRCGQTMSGLVGPLGICTGYSTPCCNKAMFPYLDIIGGKDYHDWQVSPEQLEETRNIAIMHHTETIDPPPGDTWNEVALDQLIRLIDAALADRATVRTVTRIDVPTCAQCGFKEPCSCAAFSQQEVTQCQDTSQAAVATEDLPAGGTRTTGPTTRSRAAKASAVGASR